MQTHERWLKIAWQEYGAGEALQKAHFPNQASYFAQQAAEKALKAYLVAHNIRLAKTHDLELLVQECKVINVRFLRLAYHAYFLSDYATAFRYPQTMYDDLFIFECYEILQHAKKIIHFVTSTLATEKI